METLQTVEIIERVENRAKELGLSLRKVSLLSGHGPDLIRDWRRPKSVLPRLDSIQKIASVLNVSAGWLAFGEVGEDPSHSVTRVPLISWVAASPYSETGFTEYEATAQRLAVDGLKPGKHFALLVSGDSMNRIAPEGAKIIVNASIKELLPRKFFIFQKGDAATFKRFMRNPDRLEPYSTNQEHEAISLDADTTVLGQVVKVITDLS
ncbi:XRE family transcriptional regulator [Rhizobium paknamense]|uniref:SOS-response transcriptional repressor LexA n=1 Tax=Rhizobium paknamense TaxID=1206817 RepID=A0ABU0IEF3_9HYPH|nr:S24 family peptidase [Rhizobium paknamense]MDQ0456023.1 SOS-response transcriptional repressor LexA [Rhizobium paknamense]